jgi:hypothetical protein
LNNSAIAAEFITVKLPPQKNDEVQSLLVYDAYTETDMELPPGTLRFESRFESGNLLKAFRLGHTNEYNLILEPDYSVRNPHQLHAQWFYFSIKNAVTGTSYKFNILNIGKYDGSFNQGMQPVIFHASSSADWQRNGSEIYLFKNTYYQHSPRPEEHSPLGTLTFTLDSMPNNCTANQPIYIATHFPYTLSYLQSYLNQLTVETAPSSPFIRRQLLCKTMIGNRCDLLTITDFTATDSVPPMQSRPIVLLTARVHPSESNSSYMMHGLLQFLTDATDKQAIELRRRYIFKIVPMLNPDGVVCGFHRHSLSGDDLNRQWTRPSRTRHPTVYWTKRLVDYLVNCCGKTVLLSCDFHGHSRKNNVFIYACPPPAAGEIKLESNTDNNNDKTKVNSVLEKIFPRLWQTNGGEWNAFDYHSCTFALEKSKEGTQRITFRKQFGIRCSYTCESSFNGSLFNGKVRVYI